MTHSFSDLRKTGYLPPSSPNNVETLERWMQTRFVWKPNAGGRGGGIKDSKYIRSQPRKIVALIRILNNNYLEALSQPPKVCLTLAQCSLMWVVTCSLDLYPRRLHGA